MKSSFHPMKPKKPVGLKRHKFTLVVESYGSREEAQIKVLTAFALRYPDAALFYLHRKKPV